MAHINYSRTERTIHELCFSNLDVQYGLSKLEDRYYASDGTGEDTARPVFITSLPRAGTTLLLERLAGMDAFVSHTYRDMPFIFCPVFWHRLSRSFTRSDVRRERMHGDGILVGYDSPEAFEEIFWRYFWPEKYQGNQIKTWQPDEGRAGFETFLRHHMHKLINLNQDPAWSSFKPRYVSKNNVNIARLALLSRLFPHCRIVVPFRDPLQHAASMLNQHRKFTQIHAEDPFSRKYMNWLGHREFGADLQPVNFNHWLANPDASTPGSIDFWLRYWRSAFEYVLATRTDNVVLVNFDTLCTEPAAQMRALFKCLDVNDADTAGQDDYGIKPPRAHDIDGDNPGHADIDACYAVHQRLAQLAI